jgi:methionyl-tRNA formyltransferase
LNGEDCSGVTLHRIDSGIDTGEIIDQLTFPLGAEITARDLYYKYLSCSERLLDNNFSKLLMGQIASYPQPSAGSTYFGKSSIDYANLELDLRQTAEMIHRQIRAFSFREFQTVKIADFPIGKAQITERRSTEVAGSFKLLSNFELILSTIDYDVLCYKDVAFDIFNFIEVDDYQNITSWYESGGDLNVTNIIGWTPLMVASYNGKTKTVELLISLGADPNCVNQNGTTALMYAKDYGQLSGDFKLCDLLMMSGANPGLSDRFGMTVMDYVFTKGSEAAKEYFSKLEFGE